VVREKRPQGVDKVGASVSTFEKMVNGRHLGDREKKNVEQIGFLQGVWGVRRRHNGLGNNAMTPC